MPSNDEEITTVVPKGESGEYQLEEIAVTKSEERHLLEHETESETTNECFHTDDSTSDNSCEECEQETSSTSSVRGEESKEEESTMFEQSRKKKNHARRYDPDARHQRSEIFKRH